jgi:hypothetical protein
MDLPPEIVLQIVETLGDLRLGGFRDHLSKVSAPHGSSRL